MQLRYLVGFLQTFRENRNCRFSKDQSLTQFFPLKIYKQLSPNISGKNYPVTRVSKGCLTKHFVISKNRLAETVACVAVKK
jgi:hypothetical protein